MTKVLKMSNEIFKLVYPIGSLYLSVNSVNPSILFGGNWEQITDDAYLKIVNSNGGNLGGTSNVHKIPVSSMPSHNHGGRVTVTGSGVLGLNGASGGGNYFVAPIQYVSNNASQFAEIPAQGNGNSYYPYYLGIYAWKRVS